MRRYNVMYFISQSVKSLWRNGVMTIASILVLMSCLVVMGSFAAIVMNLNSNLDSLGDMNEIVVFIDMEKNEDEIMAICEKITNYDNVKKVKYISKEVAFNEEKEKYEKDYPDFFEGVTSDIYPASCVITYNDNDQVESLKYELENTEGIYKVKCRADVASTIESLKRGVIYIFGWFLIVLFAVSLFVIINTIKLAVFSRRQEISIMRYVGATNWFIMLPFVLEGVIIGILSSGIGYLIQMSIYKFLQKMVLNDYDMISIIPFENIQVTFLIAFAV
ncbi:MAG: ABC transporter permease, partial [Clostridia bacterium]|nr:ABC transporter permease [Clostridia bacterium]